MLALLTLLACGPTLPPDAAASGPADLPAELAELGDWLAQREAAVPDIVEGAEKHIDWADPAHPARTPLAMVYLHGFSATRQEVDPMFQQVAEALGANLFLTRLTGHGRGSGEPMASGSVEAWIEDGYEALAIGRRLGEQVVVAGTSTGATLALWLASRPAGEDIAGLVLISPNFGPRAEGAWLLTAPGRSLLPLVLGRYREWEPANEEQAKYWSWRYPSRALFPMADLVELVEELDLSSVTAPALVIYSPQDDVVRPDLIEQRFPELGGQPKRLRAVENPPGLSTHVLAGRILNPELTDPLAEETTTFLREALGLPEGGDTGD